MPNAPTLLAKYSPLRRRSLMITVMCIGAVSMFGALSALLAAPAIVAAIAILTSRRADAGALVATVH